MDSIAAGVVVAADVAVAAVVANEFVAVGLGEEVTV